jgi:hypothetical protein
MNRGLVPFFHLAVRLQLDPAAGHTTTQELLYLDKFQRVFFFSKLQGHVCLASLCLLIKTFAISIIVTLSLLCLLTLSFPCFHFPLLLCCSFVFLSFYMVHALPAFILWS